MSPPLTDFTSHAEAVHSASRPPLLPVLIEKDAALFSRLTTPWAPNEGVPVTQIHLDVSSRCDQKCPLCYYPKGDSATEVSVDRAREIAQKHPGCSFILGGREPTLRPDLDLIIRAIRPYGSVLLLTHGLTLSRRGYLQSLLDAGLDGVILSFNGVSDETYHVLSGKRCLAQKWEAFATLRRLRVPTIISMTVTPGVNDRQIGAVLRLCQANTNFVKELRLRAARILGRFQGDGLEPWRMTELLEAISVQGGFPMDGLRTGIDFWHQLGEVFQTTAYRPQLCTVTFMTRKRKGQWQAEGECLTRPAQDAVQGWNRNKWLRPLYLLFLVWQMVRFYGAKPVLRRAMARCRTAGTPTHREKIQAVADCPDLLQITLKSWPDPNGFLPSEQRKCGTLYVSQKTCRPFCTQNHARNEQPN